MRELIDSDDHCYDIEFLLNNEEVNWNVPKWAKPGDIVFFMHARTAIQKISALTAELDRIQNQILPEEYDVMSAWLLRARKLYNQYGGKILAIGRVVGSPEYSYAENYPLDNSVPFHYRGRLFTDINSVVILENPIDLSEFKDFITLTLGGAITPVFGKEFERLRALIGKKNRLPRYVRESVSIPVPLKEINKKNWLELAGQYRRSFIFESEFRSFYVNYLLSEIGDSKKIYRECRCCKPTNPDSYVDNIIVFNGRYLSVEVKLNIHAERDIKGQVSKYCDVERCYLKEKDPDYIDYSVMYDTNCLIIDTYKVYLYDLNTDNVTELLDLDDLHAKSHIMGLRKKIAASLNEPSVYQKRQARKNSIHIRKQDITYVVADAIVNAANKNLKPGSGVSRAIFAAAGYYRLQAECQKAGFCDAGSAVITPAFNLQAKHIIHAVGPRWIDGRHNELKLLYQTYMKSLELAKQNGCRSIAFPLISAGSAGFPVDQAWKKAIHACNDFFKQNLDYRISVVFTSLDDNVINTGEMILSSITG